MAIDFALEIESLLSPHERLEYKEYKELTAKFKKDTEKREQRELTNCELFSLVSDNQYYQEQYMKLLDEPNVRECLKILISVEPSILEDKNILKTIKTWRLV